jgi:hypothetical protein
VSLDTSAQSFEKIVQKHEAKGGGIMPHVSLQPLIALIAGILILVFPRILNFIVAIYLIIVGVMGLIGKPL